MKFGDLRDTWKPGDEVPAGYYISKLDGRLQCDYDFAIYNAEGEVVDLPDRRARRLGGSGRTMLVISDIDPYRSVIDGSVIGGRRAHRDHLRAHGCREVGNEKLTEQRSEMSDPKRDAADAVYGRARLSERDRAELRRAQRIE